MSEQALSIIEQLEQLAPLCNAAVKKELSTLVAIMREVGAASVSELKKPIVDAVKTQRTSAAGFAKRIQSFLETQPNAEPVEALVADFRTLAATTVKSIAKKFDLNLASKEDADAFEKWLRTGVKPPTAEELIADEIDELALKAIELRDATHSALPNENIDGILEIAENVKKKHKTDGLRLFLKAFNLEPTGKSTASMIKDLKGYLQLLALDRYKRSAIRVM